MKDKIFAELKKKYAGQLTTKFIESLADRLSEKVEKEEDIEGVIGELEFSPIKVTDLQAEGDRRATEVSVKVKDLKEQIEKLKNPPKEEPKGEPNGEPKHDHYTELKKELDEIKKRESRRELLTKLTEKAKAKNIPQVLIDNTSIDIEDDVDEVLSGLEAKAKELKQQMISEGLVSEPPKRPSGGGGEDEEVKEAITKNKVRK